MKTPLHITGTLPTALNVLGADGKPLANRQLVLKWGDNVTTKGLVRVGKRTASVLPSLQKKLGLDKVALDYNHNTEKGTPAYEEEKSEPRKVAAYGQPEVVVGEGVYLSTLEFNPHGTENAQHFKDLSAVVVLDENGEVLLVKSVALCRHGSAEGIEVQTVALSIDLPEAEETELKLSLVALAADDEVLKVLGEKLRNQEWVRQELEGQARRNQELASENLALRTAMEAMAKTLEEMRAELAANRTALERVPQVTALNAELDGFTGKLAELAKEFEGKLTAHEKTALLREAARMGKVVPLSADALGKLSPAELADTIAQLKPTMPVGRVTALHIREPGAEGAAATGLEADVRRMCGLPPK